MRANATIPKWDESLQLWIYRPYIDAVQKKYTSDRPGDKGAKECLKKYSSALAGMNLRSVRLGTAWEDYQEDVKQRLGADSESYRKTVSIGKTHIVPNLKMKKVADITDQDWQTIINKAKPDRGGRSELSKKTLKNIRAEIIGFCKYAKKGRIIEHLPESLYIPKNAPVIGKEIIQPDELVRFLSDDRPEWWYLQAWQLMVVTGLRPGEVYGLKRSDVKDGMIRIDRSIRQDGKTTSGKNHNAIRIMLQTDPAAKIINAQLAKLKAHKVALPWLFPDEDGGKPNPVVIYHDWEDYRNQLPQRVTLYGLRHTWVSLMQKELPDSLMKLLLGHSPTMDTKGTYGHTITGDDRQAADIVNAVFDKLFNKTSTN